ncbi:hypothetical protein KQ910_07930 [Reyranella sp. MMS21-HV4-11]|uniref:Uncharacterized protein n=1 Tax=Reyranella humidisoli TaxID=2849149 RepID=A0ABS6IGI3_9HYPH|nr:hypothetical protein [Reyranella sp. MMS21-HV4-11]MBU8873689.1 hypothetical protein [Reyranella sp. MMS21-HV4-11]
MSKIAKIQKGLVKAMQQAGIRPELIYAYEQTGILVVEEGYAKLSPAERAEYDAAIDAYRARHR